MIEQPSEGLRPYVAWTYVALNVPLVTTVYLFPKEHVYLWGLLGVGSALAIVYGIARNRPARRSAWVVIAMGVATFAVGDITYDVLTEFMHEVNPYPSLADVFYLATYVFLSTGLILMVRARRLRNGEGGAAVDALIVTAGLGALSWIYLIQPYVHAVDMDMLVKIDVDRVSAGRHTDALRDRSPALRRRDPRDVGATVGGRRDGRLGRRLHLRLDPAPRQLEGGRSDRPGMGALLRVLGCRGAASGDARPDAPTTVATAPPESRDAHVAQRVRVGRAVGPRLSRRRERPVGRRHPRHRVARGLRVGHHSAWSIWLGHSRSMLVVNKPCASSRRISCRRRTAPTCGTPASTP